MARQRIIEVHGEREIHWERAGAALERALAVSTSIDALQLLRIDAHTGVLVLVAADEGALARASAELVDPWLAAQGLATTALAREGELVLEHRRVAADDDGQDEAQRLALFVRTVTASGTLWGLRAKTWARSAAAGEREALALWSTRASATRCIDGAWADFVAAPIDLDAFVEQWLPGMAEDGIVAVLMATPTRAGVIVEPRALAGSLTARDDAGDDAGD